MKTISKGRRPPMEEDLKNIKCGIWLSTKQALTKRETLRVSWVWLCSTQNCHAFVKWKPIVFSSEMNFYFILVLINRNRNIQQQSSINIIMISIHPTSAGGKPSQLKNLGQKWNNCSRAEEMKCSNWEMFFVRLKTNAKCQLLSAMNVCHLKAPIL